MDAAEAFQHAVDLDPGNVSANLYLAVAYLQQYVPCAKSPDNRGRHVYRYRSIHGNYLAKEGHVENLQPEALLNGQPVEVVTTVDVTFTLPR